MAIVSTLALQRGFYRPDISFAMSQADHARVEGRKMTEVAIQCFEHGRA
jgi:hypothetical protein